MNTPNPLIPQGALERHSKGKSTVRIAIFTIISIHAVFFTGLLMQGCRRDDGKPAALLADAATNQNSSAPLDPGYYPSAQEVPPAAPIPAAPSSTAPYAAEVSPSQPVPMPSEPAWDGKSHTIVRGDTLAKIAKANGVTVTAITRLNPAVEPSRLKPGQIIQIPLATSTASTGFGFAEPATSEPGDGQLHTVKRGETLTRIAKAHGTSVRAIKSANNLKTDHLAVGQKLKLPAPSSASTKLSANDMAQVSVGDRTSLR